MVEPADIDPVGDAWDVLQDLAKEGADPLHLGRPFMERLGPADWSVVEKRGHPVRYPGGSIIFREGDIGDELFVVLSGRVAVLKDQGNGQSALLAYRGPGDILGEMSVMGHVPRSATVVAVDDTDALCVKSEDFWALTSAVPGLCRTMLYVLSERLRAADIARTAIVQEERDLLRRLERRTTEAERLAELARLRQQTVDLIVHDLRSPLGVIRGCLDVLQESLSEESLESSAEVLAIARRSNDRLLSLVEQLLEAARREVLGIRLELESLSLHPLVSGVLDGLRATALSAGIELRMDVSPDLPTVRGDRGELERVFGNLLDNAISYTPGGGRVVLAATATGTEVEISVTDTGPGIPPEYREQIFERFARVPGITGRRRGFGLGLYFCRQVVQAHGGRIWVEPGPGGVGSRFAVVLSQEVGEQP